MKKTKFLLSKAYILVEEHKNKYTIDEVVLSAMKKKVRLEKQLKVTQQTACSVY